MGPTGLCEHGLRGPSRHQQGPLEAPPPCRTLGPVYPMDSKAHPTAGLWEMLSLLSALFSSYKPSHALLSTKPHN